MSATRLSEEPVRRRREVMRVLRASADPMSIIAIADLLGVHANTVRFHLDNLLSDGLVERAEAGRKGPGRPALMFRAVRQMDREGPRRYRLLAEILTEGIAAEPDPRAAALSAGRAWGQQLAAPLVGATSAEESIEHLVDVLDELGFAPERRGSDGEQQIGLRHCPFLDLAEKRTGIVCPAHLGLMQGALARWAAPIAIDRLDPFVEPDLCLAHLTLQSATE